MKNRKSMCELLERIPGYCVRVPCDKCPLRGRKSEKNDKLIVKSREDGLYIANMKKSSGFCYKGYVLQPIENTDRYFIINKKSGKIEARAQCDLSLNGHVLTKKEAREHIRFFINLKKKKG